MTSGGEGPSGPAASDPTPQRPPLDVRGGWTRIAMDGATLPVQTLLLAHDPATGRRRLLVRFPAGFERPEAGSYQTRERFLLLAGQLEIGGQLFVPGDLVVIDAGVQRMRTRTVDGALALVVFEAHPEWSAADERREQGLLPVRHLQPPGEFCAGFWDI